MSAPYEGSHQQYGVVRDDDVMVPMRDGVSLATDIYFPASDGRRADGKFPVLLERTPYNKRRPGNVTDGKFFARRGYSAGKVAGPVWHPVAWIVGIIRLTGRISFAGQETAGFDTTSENVEPMAQAPPL